MRIDKRHVTLYTWAMIKTFEDRRTQELYATGKSKWLPPDITRRMAHLLSVR
jgi:hypothetical protein